MRSRLALLAAVSSLALGSLTACGGGGGSITMKGEASAPSTTVADAAPDPTSAPTDESTGSSDDMTTIPSDGATGAAPDLAECTELADAMSTMAMAAIGSEVTPEAQAKIDKVKAGLPEQVRNDLDTLVNGYEQLSKSGNLSDAAGAVNTPEFAAASDRLSTYFNDSCGTGG